MSQKEKKQTLLGYLFFMPSLAVLAVFVFYPLSYMIYLSFFEWSMVKPMKRLVGLANYTAVFRDPNSWKIAGNAAVYIPVLLVLNFMLSYILSSVLSAVIKRRQGFYKVVLFLPSIISPVVGSTLYIWILNPISGLVVLVLKYFGLVLPFQSRAEEWVIAVLSIIISWEVLDYNFIIILAGVSGVFQEVVKAARLDNTPLWKIFHDIVVPMSSATGIYAFITTIVQGLQYVSTPIKVVTQGDPSHASSNLIYVSYHEAFTLYCTDASSVVSMIIIVLFIALLFLEFRFIERGVYYES